MVLKKSNGQRSAAGGLCTVITDQARHDGPVDLERAGVALEIRPLGIRGKARQGKVLRTYCTSEKSDLIPFPLMVPGPLSPAARMGIAPDESHAGTVL